MTLNKGLLLSTAVLTETGIKEISVNQDVISGKRTVAFFNILDFKNIINSTDLQQLADVYERVVYTIQFMNRRKLGADPLSIFEDHPLDLPYCKTFILSGSIIMISNGPEAAETNKTLICAWRALQTFISCGIPLRGAVAFGEMYINPSRNIFLGPALTRAAELEKGQEWVGAVIDDNVIAELSHLKHAIDNPNKLLSKVFRKYDVPFKNGITREFYTLNWRACLMLKNGARSLFNFSGDEAADIKFTNALKYAHGGRGGGPPGNTPPEYSNAWVGSNPPYADAE